MLSLPSWLQASLAQTMESGSWGEGVFSSKSRPLETFLKSHWPELGHVLIPKVVIGKGERAGFQADLQLSRLHPIPEHLWSSVGRKMVGVNVQLETH